MRYCINNITNMSVIYYLLLLYNCRLRKMIVVRRHQSFVVVIRDYCVITLVYTFPDVLVNSADCQF